MLLLLACAGPGGVVVPGTTPPEGAVDLVGDALASRCPDAAPPNAPAGDDLHRVTLDGAVCNDGTPAVAYVRAATAAEHARDWVVHLDGGSFCADHEGCAVRWCGEGFYDAARMSSAWSPPAIGGDGMRSAEGWNAFAGWNHALVHYCTSDAWSGTARDVVLDGDPPYRLHFDGHEVVLAALDALERGARSDDGAEALPPLGEAATVLFTGGSAGAFGAAQHVRDVIGRLPEARVIAGIDSFLPPPAEVMTAVEAAARVADVEATWVGVDAVWDGVLDPTCAAALGDEWRCSDLDVALRSGPVPELAVHQDLLDPVLYPSYEEIGFSTERLAELWVDGLHLYAETVPGAALHASRCRHHTALSETPRFAELTVADDLGTPWSLHDVLVAQLAGQPVVAIDSGGLSACR